MITRCALQTIGARQVCHLSSEGFILVLVSFRRQGCTDVTRARSAAETSMIQGHYPLRL